MKQQRGQFFCPGPSAPSGLSGRGGRHFWRNWPGVLAAGFALLFLTGCGTQIRDVTANPRYKTDFATGSVYVLQQSALLEVWNHPTRYALISNSAANLRTPPSECGPWVHYTHDRYRDDDDAEQCPPVTLAELRRAELQPDRDEHEHRWHEHRRGNLFHPYHRHQNPWIRTVCPSGARIRIVAIDLITRGSRRRLAPLATILTGPLTGLRVWVGGICYVSPFTHLLQADPMYLAALQSAPPAKALPLKH